MASLPRLMRAEARRSASWRMCQRTRPRHRSSMRRSRPSARSHRGIERGHSPLSRIPRDLAGGMGRGAAHQPLRRVLSRAPRHPAYARAQVGAHHPHLRLRRLLGPGHPSRPQHHQQGRPAWPRQGDRARIRARRDHSEHGGARRIDTERDWSQYPHQEKQRIEAEIPARRFGDPAEVAAAVAFLASPEGAFISGQATHVNGGHYMI